MPSSSSSSRLSAASGLNGSTASVLPSAGAGSAVVAGQRQAQPSAPASPVAMLPASSNCNLRRGSARGGSGVADGAGSFVGTAAVTEESVAAGSAGGGTVSSTGAAAGCGRSPPGTRVTAAMNRKPRLATVWI